MHLVRSNRIEGRLGAPAESLRAGAAIDPGKGSFTESIQAAVIESLCSVASRENTSSTAVLLSAFATLIYRYTRSSEPISIDVSVVPEPYPLDADPNEFDRQMPSSAVKVQLNGDLSVSEVIRNVDRAVARAFADGGLPCLLKDGVARSISFSWRDSDQPDAGLLQAILQTHNGLVTELSYERLLSNAEPALQTGSHWRTLLAGMDCDPKTPIFALPILGPEEKSQILADLRGSVYDGELTRHECLHQLFEAQASVHPERIALIRGGDQMTYGELDQRANQLARRLRSKGVVPGSNVGMFLPRSMDVYVALLGILKSGAAYVPIDPECPSDRAEFILADCGVAALVTTGALADGLSDVACPVIRMDAEADAIREELPHALTSVGVEPADLAYIIYTSGSTGRPKGVQIEHRSVCNLVRAEGRLFRVLPSDRIYQGFSIAFDASVEEVWLAFFAGAALVVGTSEMVHAGPALAGMLAEAGVTVLSCVPTLLSMMDDDIPTLRLLIFGGEACPGDLAEKWARDGRRVYNTYGPTEATVIATCAECKPAESITIGRPIPNYSVYVLDEYLQPVPLGVPGELHLGGVGLSRGYVGLTEMTASKFIPNPFGADPGAPARLYKTGDLVRFNAAGNIEFLGRTDSQVKIRGFRVEPTEIESVLRHCAGVQSAAVSIRPDLRGIQQIVAYVIPRRDEVFDEGATKAELRSRLPAYMVPSIFVILDEFPTLSSGKVDRKSLPAPRWQCEGPKRCREAANEIEAKVLEVWESLFAPQQVSPEDDFFDLGGHSLLAAKMVSELRKDPRFRQAAMLDVYQHPKLEDYARELARKAAAAPENEESAAQNAAAGANKVSKRAFYACSAGQIGGLYLVFGLFALPWLLSYFASKVILAGGHSLFEAVLVLECLFAGTLPALMLVSVAAKWLLIGRYKEGSYPLWGSYYWRFWLVRRIEALVPVTYLRGTPLLAMYGRMMGAKIGRNVYLGTHHFCAFDLLEIGDDTSLGMEAQLQGYTVENGVLRVGRISIGKRCYIGARAVLSPGTTMHDDSRLDEQSMLPEGGTIPAHETWAGSPARLAGMVIEQPPIGRRTSRLVAYLQSLYYALSVMVFLPAVVLGAGLPGGLFLLKAIVHNGMGYGLLWSPLVSFSFVALLALEIAALKWILIGHVRAGKYAIRGAYYMRKWFVDCLLQMSLLMLHPLYATLYLAPWFRLLGAKLGKRVEISTAGHISPDLLNLGAECFIADSACLGAPRVHLGYLTIEPTTIGRRTFIGNSALVPPSAKIGSGCLIGCMSVPPANEVIAEHADSSWLGSPSVILPRRQDSGSFPDSTTFCPPWYLYLIRGFIEFWRITMPTTLFIVLSALLIGSAAELGRVFSTVGLMLMFPAVYAAAAGVTVLAAVAIKWVLIGRYRPQTKPLWCHFIWRTEMITAMHETYVGPFLLNLLQGTPFISWYFRAMGSKIGGRVYMDTTQMTEFDMVEVGDDVTLNVNATLQTHLFEDRIMKISKLRVGDNASVGTMAVVLYDSEMEPGASLGGLSLLMKGETLPEWTRWEGIPARRAT